MTKINLPRGITVDIDNVPENFDEIIKDEKIMKILERVIKVVINYSKED